MSDTSSVRIEHLALNVTDPVAMAGWYCENLGMRILRSGPPPGNARFLADASGNVILEIYNNPPDAVPDYAKMDPLVLHVAFQVGGVREVCERLLAAGCSLHAEAQTLDNGDCFCMLRDPWGLALQLMKRSKAML